MTEEGELQPKLLDAGSDTRRLVAVEAMARVAAVRTAAGAGRASTRAAMLFHCLTLQTVEPLAFKPK
eukprot:1552189-Prymnesium_polylepis.1